MTDDVVSTESDGRPAFVELDKARHDRGSFRSGKPSLDDFLQKQAVRHAKAGTSRTLVLPGPTPDADGRFPVLAFFSASFTTIRRADLPPAQAKSLPRYPLPAFLIAQLAVDGRVARQGHGSSTLVAAIAYLLDVHERLPAVAIVVDCLDDDARRFYERFGFEPLTLVNGLARLFLPMGTAQRLLKD